jgi:hypothetical protein
VKLITIFLQKILIKKNHKDSLLVTTNKITNSIFLEPNKPQATMQQPSSLKNVQWEVEIGQSRRHTIKQA